MTSKNPKERERALAHALVDRLFDRKLEPALRVEAGANLRAIAAQRIAMIDKRFFLDVADEIAEKLRKLPRGGGIA